MVTCQSSPAAATGTPAQPRTDPGWRYIRRGQPPAPYPECRSSYCTIVRGSPGRCMSTPAEHCKYSAGEMPLVIGLRRPKSEVNSIVSLEFLVLEIYNDIVNSRAHPRRGRPSLAIKSTPAGYRRLPWRTTVARCSPRSLQSSVYMPARRWRTRLPESRRSCAAAVMHECQL